MTDDAAQRLAPYEARLNELWERMVRAIGIHTVNVLMERALWQGSQKHPELALIQRTDDGLVFGPFEEAAANMPEEEIATAFDDLTSDLLLILTRLLGREMAGRLSEELKARMAEETQSKVQEVTR